MAGPNPEPLYSTPRLSWARLRKPTRSFPWRLALGVDRAQLETRSRGLFSVMAKRFGGDKLQFTELGPSMRSLKERVVENWFYHSKHGLTLIFMWPAMKNKKFLALSVIIRWRTAKGNGRKRLYCLWTCLMGQSAWGEELSKIFRVEKTSQNERKMCWLRCWAASWFSRFGYSSPSFEVDFSIERSKLSNIRQNSAWYLLTYSF
jgi:hypothetical protein